MKDCGVTMILSAGWRKIVVSQAGEDDLDKKQCRGLRNRGHGKDDDMIMVRHNDMTTIWWWVMTLLVYSPTQCICCWGQMQRSWCRICDPGTQPHMTCPAEKGERLEVCKGRRIKGTEKQEEEAEDFVEAELHYEGREGWWVWNPSYEDYTMRMGIKRVRDDPRDIQENYREASLVSRKRWHLDISGQGRPKRGQKRKGGQDFEFEEPEYPKPWQRGGVHIRQSQDISHPQTWNKRDVKRVQLSALCCHEKTFHYGTLSSAVIP